MNSLTEKNELLEQAETLNNSLNNNFLALSMVLYEVKETEAYKEAGYEEWVDYYTKHLNREKSAISRLLAAGKFLRERYGGRLPEATISYKLLAASANRNPEADPEYVISEALTWTEDDHKESKKDECKHEKPPVLVCPDCWKRIDHA